MKNATSFNQDGYESALLGSRGLLGGVIDRFGVTPELLYAQGGLYARVVDLPADKATSRGVNVVGDVDGEIAAEFDRLHVLSIISDALRWARLTGGAGIVVLADDGRSSEPLDVDAMLSIDELFCYPLTSFSPEGAKYSDPNHKNFNQPQWYRVRTGTAGFVVHETRIIPVSGGPLPPLMGVSTNVPWAGRAEVARTYAAIARLTRALELSNNILERKQQAVYRMSGLASLIQQKLEEAVQKRISLVDSVRGVLNTVAIDSEDGYAIEDTSLSGIKDILGEQKVSVSSEAGIPITLLFGESPGGMNATGAADFQGFHEMVEGLQRNRAQPALERLVSLVLAQSTFQPTIEDWHIDWPALETPTDKELAEIRNKNADSEVKEITALETALGTSLISDTDARSYLAELGRYGLKPAEGGSRQEVKRYAQQTE